MLKFQPGHPQPHWWSLLGQKQSTVWGVLVSKTGTYKQSSTRTGKIYLSAIMQTVLSKGPPVTARNRIQYALPDRYIGVRNSSYLYYTVNITTEATVLLRFHVINWICCNIIYPFYLIIYTVLNKTHSTDSEHDWQKLLSHRRNNRG